MNVLWDVAINLPQPFGVNVIPVSTRHLAIVDAAQLVVLGVEVSLECFAGGEKSQDRGITLSETTVRGCHLAHGTREEAAPHRCCAAKCQAGFQKTAAVPGFADHVFMDLHAVPPFHDLISRCCAAAMRPPTKGLRLVPWALGSVRRNILLSWTAM